MWRNTTCQLYQHKVTNKSPFNTKKASLQLCERFCAYLTLSCTWLWSARCRSICALRVAVYPQSGQAMWPPSLSWQYLMWSLREAPRWYILWQNGQACWVLPASGVQRDSYRNVHTFIKYVHLFSYPSMHWARCRASMSQGPQDTVNYVYKENPLGTNIRELHLQLHWYTTWTLTCNIMSSDSRIRVIIQMI